MSRISILNASVEDFALEVFASAPASGSVGDYANGRLVKYGAHLYLWCDHQGIWAKFANVTDFTSLETRLSQQEDANDADVASLELVDSSLESRIAASESDRASELASLQLRATTAESSLEDKISTEESTMASDVSSEQTRAVSVETSLLEKINSAVSDRTSDVVSLETRAVSVETSLQTRLSEQEDASDAADSSLTVRANTAESDKDSGDADVLSSLSSASADRASDDSSLETFIEDQEATVSAILLAADADKDSFAEVVSLINAESVEQNTETSQQFASLEVMLASVETAHAATDSSLESRIATAESDRSAADVSLTNRVAAEETAAAAADASLTSRVNDGEDDRALKDASLETMIASVEAALIDNDTSLEEKISVEEDARESGDTSLEVFATSVETSLVGIDASLEERISKEEASMEDALDSLEVARIAADSDLSDDVSIEEASREAKDDEIEASISAMEVALTIADTSLNARIAAEETTFATAASSLESSLSDVESVLTEADGDFEASMETAIDVEEARVSAILAGAGADPNTFVEMVSFITEFDVDADDQLASYELALDSRILAEETAMAAGDLSLESLISDKVADRISSMTSLEGHHSTEIASLGAAIDSLELREENRHLRVDFGGTTPVTSFTVPGTSFPAGFRMDEHGMVQVFQDMGSSKFRHLVAPVEVDMTSGDVTVQLGSSAKSGFAVFYMFADDEGAVTQVQNAYQMQMGSNSYNGSSEYLLTSSPSTAISFPSELHIRDYANATSQTSYGYTSWTIDGPFYVGINWGSDGETGAYIRWYSEQSTDGGSTWSSSGYYDYEVSINSYGASGGDSIYMPSYDPVYDFPRQALSEGGMYRVWAEGYNTSGALVLQAGSSSSPYYFLDRTSYTYNPGSYYDYSSYPSQTYYWNSSNAYALDGASHGDSVDVTIVNPSTSATAPGASFSDAIWSASANYNASDYYGWDQNSVDWTLSGTGASFVDLDYNSGIQSSLTNQSYLSLYLANNTVPPAGTYSFTIEAQGEDLSGNLLGKVTFNVTMIIS